MAFEQYIENRVACNDFDTDNICSTKTRKPESGSISLLDHNSSGDFNCNICLDSVQDPVVTFCGHLFCWPCIYKWLHFQSVPEQNDHQRQQQCPVCKSEVSSSTLVPLYGRGQTRNSTETKVSVLGKDIPRRPFGPAYGFDIPRSSRASANLNLSGQIHLHYPHQNGYLTSPMLSSYSNLLDHPMIRVLGEMVCARLFGTSMTNLYPNSNSYSFVGSSSPRVRRHMLQADKSLRRICFFLLCCTLLCLLLF